MRRALLLLALLSCGDDGLGALPPPVAGPAAGALEGRICASEAGIGSGAGYWLAGAQVSITAGGTVYEALTDAEGFFRLDSLPAGVHALHVSAGSFVATEEVVITAGATATIDHVCLAPTTRLAVVTGLFDNVEQLLGELGFAVRECLPAGSCGASLDPAGNITLVDGSDADYVTELLMDPLRLGEEQVLFLNCGLADDYLRSAPPEAIGALHGFVAAGGSLYVSDWAYEALRLAFPGRFDFWGDEASAGAARAGLAQSLTAEVVDATLASVLGAGAVSLVYDKASWAALAPSQAGDVDVWIRGDPALSGSTPAGAPLLVSAPVGSGRIVFTTFHTHQQASADMLAVLRHLVFEL